MGLLLARVPVNRIYEYGQNLRLRGKLQTPPQNEDFSYRDYLARQGIHGYMPDAEATVLPGSTANPILALQSILLRQSCWIMSTGCSSIPKPPAGGYSAGR